MANIEKTGRNRKNVVGIAGEASRNVVPFKKDAMFFFRRGIKYINRNKYSESIKFLQKAVELDPYNLDYLFNLAGVQAELKLSEESNHTLMRILMDIDPTFNECYFGMGCNHFELGNLKKARECFEKYICLNPDGEYVLEAQDVLMYLQASENSSFDDKMIKKVSKLDGEGKKHLSLGEYEQCIEKLEQALEIEPELIAPRNNLSLSYFFMGNVEKAMSLARSVLILEPLNVHANCNLAVFYKYAGKKRLYNKQITILEKMLPDDVDNGIKLMDTFIWLGEHESILRLLLRMNDPGKNGEFLRVLGISMYNLHMYDEAVRTFTQYQTEFPDRAELAQVYISLTNRVIEHPEEFTTLDYMNKRKKNEE